MSPRPQILSCRYKKERSVAFKIYENSAGELMTLPRSPSRLGRGHPSPHLTNPPSAFAMRPPQNSSQIYAYDGNLCCFGAVCKLLKYAFLNESPVSRKTKCLIPFKMTSYCTQYSRLGRSVKSFKCDAGSYSIK